MIKGFFNLVCYKIGTFPLFLRLFHYQSIHSLQFTAFSQSPGKVSRPKRAIPTSLFLPPCTPTGPTDPHQLKGVLDKLDLTESSPQLAPAFS
jgi:hypothetical protein